MNTKEGVAQASIDCLQKATPKKRRVLEKKGLGEEEGSFVKVLTRVQPGGPACVDTVCVRKVLQRNLIDRIPCHFFKVFLYFFRSFFLSFFLSCMHALFISSE